MEVKTITVVSYKEIPKDFTGIAIHLNGVKYWIVNGKLHREDGPAFEYFGEHEWFFHGKRHRTDGPAIDFPDGEIAWYINDFEYDSKEDWFNALTPEQKENALWSEDLWRF